MARSFFTAELAKKTHVILPSTLLQGIKVKHIVVPADYNAIWSAMLIKVRTGGITQALGWVIGLE